MMIEVAANKPYNDVSSLSICLMACFFLGYPRLGLEPLHDFIQVS